MTRRSRSPRAMISVAVLVCLLVITIICGSLLRRTQTQRELVRTEERRLQADWLVESGLERAAARLRQDGGYRGETWTVSASDLGGPDSAVVSIGIAPAAGQAGNQGHLVTVVADFPTDPPRRVRSRRQATAEVSSSSGAKTP